MNKMFRTEERIIKGKWLSTKNKDDFRKEVNKNA